MMYNSNGKVVRISSQIGSARYTVPSRSGPGLAYKGHGPQLGRPLRGWNNLTELKTTPSHSML
jgi:hypothetical protein